MDEAELLTRAGSGDAEAQAELARHSITHGRVGACPPIEAETAAEMLARLAASSGISAHRMMLAGVLLVRARAFRNEDDPERSVNLQQEAVGMFEGLVAEGDRQAGPHLAALLSTLADDGNETAAALTDDEKRDHLKETLEEFRASARDELPAMFPELQNGSDQLPEGFKVAASLEAPKG